MFREGSQYHSVPVTSSSDLTCITLMEGAVGWGSTDCQDVIMLESHGHTGVLSSTLTPALAVSCPMISTENAITATSPGTRSTRSSRSQLGIKTADPVSPLTRWDEGTWEGGESSSCGLIGSLDEITCMIPKKVSKKILWFSYFFDFLAIFPTRVCPIGLQMFWRRTLTCTR